jgi:hypothetical protein
MSMEVDYTTPLTDKEREFLLERGRYADIERMDNSFSTDTSYGEGDGTGLVQRSVVSSDVMADRKAALLRELAQIEELESSTTVAPVDGEDEDEDPGYESWKVSELQEEIDQRNADGRSDEYKINRNGTKPELAARLREDDATADSDE